MKQPVYYTARQEAFRPERTLLVRQDGAQFCRAAGEASLVLALFPPGTAHEPYVFGSALRQPPELSVSSPIPSLLQEPPRRRAEVLFSYEALYPPPAPDDSPCGYLAPCSDLLKTCRPLPALLRDIRPAPQTRLALARGIVRVFAQICQAGQYVGAAPLSSFLGSEEGDVLFVGFDQCHPDSAKAERAGVPTEAQYLSPDALLCSPPVYFSNESDFFYLAMLLFRVLTDRHPFALEEESSADVLAANICDGRSIYFSPSSAGALASRRMLAACPPAVDRAFERVFDYCGRSSYKYGLLDFQTWYSVLSSSFGPQIELS